METLSVFVMTYFVGWCFGFLTCVFLVWHVVNKQQKVPVKMTRAEELNPHKYDDYR